MRRALVWIALIIGAGCASAPPVAADGEVPGVGAAISMRAPSRELDALAVEFSGSCAFARPPGDVASYSDRIIIATSGAAVFATAEFAAGSENRIGRLEGGIEASGEGPLAGGREHGSGYALVLRDLEGRVCRGYVASDGVALTPGPRPP